MQNENRKYLRSTDYQNKLKELLIFLTHNCKECEDEEQNCNNCDTYNIDYDKLFRLLNAFGAESYFKNKSIKKTNQNFRSWFRRDKTIDIPCPVLNKLKDYRKSIFTDALDYIMEANGVEIKETLNKLIKTSQIPEDVFGIIDITGSTTNEECAKIIVTYFYFLVLSTLDPESTEVEKLIEEWKKSLLQSAYSKDIKRYSDSLILKSITSIFDTENVASDVMDIEVCSTKDKNKKIFLNKLLNENFVDNILLIGQSGSGKTYSIINFIKKYGDGRFIYIPLEEYSINKLSDLKSEPDWLILYITAKVLLGDMHYYSEQLTKEDRIIITTLRENFITQDPDKEQPVYTLVLDGYNKLPRKYRKNFDKELNSILKDWMNVRIVLTTTDTVTPSSDVIKGFDEYIVLGISDKDIEQLICHENDKSEIEDNEKLKKLLKLPLYYSLFKANKSECDPIGVILDNCIMSIQGDDILRFLLQIALPFAAEKMEHFSISRAEFLSYLDKSIDLFLNNDAIYQDFINQLDLNKKQLLESRKNDDWIDIILSKTSILIESHSKINYISFSNDYLLNFFQAKHIVNAIYALSTVSKFYSADEISELAHEFKIDIHDSLFHLEDSNYAIIRTCNLIAEISRDGMQNDSHCLENYLNLCRSSIQCSTEFALKILALSRNKTIKAQNLRDLIIEDIPTFCKYEGCDFTDSFIIHFPIFDYHDYTYAEKGDFIAIVINNKYGPDVYIFNKSNEKIKHYNCYEYSNYQFGGIKTYISFAGADEEVYSEYEFGGDSNFYVDFFKNDNNKIILFSEELFLHIDINSNIIIPINKNDSRYEILKKRYQEIDKNPPKLPIEFLEKIVTSDNLFPDCILDDDDLLIGDEYQRMLLKRMRGNGRTV